MERTNIVPLDSDILIQMPDIKEVWVVWDQIHEEVISVHKSELLALARVRELDLETGDRFRHMWDLFKLED